MEHKKLSMILKKIEQISKIKMIKNQKLRKRKKRKNPFRRIKRKNNKLMMKITMMQKVKIIFNKYRLNCRF
jgi:hypothetical protein